MYVYGVYVRFAVDVEVWLVDRWWMADIWLDVHSIGRVIRRGQFKFIIDQHNHPGTINGLAAFVKTGVKTCSENALTLHQKKYIFHDLGSFNPSSLEFP